MARTRVPLSGLAFEIKEKWFKSAATPLLRAVNIMIADTYPFEVRDPNSKKYNAEKAEEYDKALRRAQNFLYEQRNLVNDRFLPRYIIKRSKSGAEKNEATQELANVLLENCLDRLYENLVAYSPLFVAEEYREPLHATLSKVYETEKERFHTFLDNFAAEYADGVVPLAQEYGVV